MDSKRPIWFYIMQCIWGNKLPFTRPQQACLHFQIEKACACTTKNIYKIMQYIDKKQWIYTNKWWFQRWQQAFLFWNCYVTLTFCSLLARCRIPCACHAKPHPNFQKLRFVWVVIVCDWMPGKRKENFQKWSFDFQMCFAPQLRALIKHLNFQKRSDVQVFCTFSLGNALRATAACAFSTSQFLKSFRSWGALYFLTLTCASRHISSGQMAPHPPL